MLGIASSSAPFFLGLLVIVLGTGLLKPNASAIVAQLYPQGGARRDAGFTIYYIGVNLGATLGPLLTGAVAARYGWHAGFMMASIGMTAGVLQFLCGRRLLGECGRVPPATAPVAGRRCATRRSACWGWRCWWRCSGAGHCGLRRRSCRVWALR